MDEYEQKMKEIQENHVKKMKEIQENHFKRMKEIQGYTDTHEIEHEVYIMKLGISIQALRQGRPKKKIYFGKVKTE